MLILESRRKEFLGGGTCARIFIKYFVFEAKLLEDDDNFPRVGTLGAVDSELLSVGCRHFEIWGEI